MRASKFGDDFLGLGKFLAAAKKFFREEAGEIIGAYFDGEKLFVVRLTEKFETVELDAYGEELEQLAEKISLTCKERAWKTSAVGFCLREEDVVTFQTEVGNLPEKEIPAMVKSWAAAQAGNDAAFSFAKVGEELWMETLPRTRLEEICAAFGKFGLNLRGLSAMPADSLTKVAPFDRTEFISEVVRNKKAPNLLEARASVWSWQRISQAAATVFLIALTVATVETLLDYTEASEALEAAELAVDDLREDVALKKAVDADIDELHRLNALAAAQADTSPTFNLLINLGKTADKTIRLTTVRVDKDSLELEGLGDTPDAVKDYLARVKDFAAQKARLESSSERDDGDIAFVIRCHF